jgi:glycosyltransferase involved in cell wall biosynthesis
MSEPPVNRLRVLFINRSYWPDVEATGQYLTELCEDLAREMDVHVICGRPQQALNSEAPAAYGSSTRHGVAIHRLPHTQFDKASFLGRLINMATFQATAAWRSLCVPRPAVVVVETDPPLLCLLGGMLARLRGARVVCYLQDIYPDVAVALGKLRPGRLTRWLRRLFFRSYRRASAVVVLSRDMRALMLDSGVPADKLHTIANWVDVDEIFPVKTGNQFRRRHGLDGKFVVMYSGNMGMSQRLEQALDAAALLRDREDIVFAMVGGGADRRRLQRLAADKQLANVRFYDYLPKSQLADSLSAADVHLVILRPEIKQLLMPSKLYGVLASGTPAVVLADADCELAEIVTACGGGVVVPSDDTEQLAATLRECADAPQRLADQGRRARAYAEAHCRREASVAKIRDLIIQLAGRQPAAGSAPASVVRPPALAGSEAL